MVLSKDSFYFHKTPVENFKELFDLAHKTGVADPTAMILSTVGPNLKPSSRVVLLKGIEEGGFLFYTNYQSSKAKDIAENPNVEILFYWPELSMQIKISGQAKKTSREQSVKYFSTRPRLSQLGAWASAQSEFIEGYEVLENNLNKFHDQFRDKEIPCPPHWGGFRIEPESFEYWFGMEGRLHFRYIYQKSGDDWIRAMKSP